MFELTVEKIVQRESNNLKLALKIKQYSIMKCCNIEIILKN